MYKVGAATDRGKRRKITNEVQPGENINKNPHGVLVISHVQKEVPLDMYLWIGHLNKSSR